MLDCGLEVRRLSKIYETDAVSDFEQPEFLNMVAEIDGSALPPPESMLARLLRIEYSLGRTREVPKGPRTIDLDLLLYQDETRDTDFLALPHPRLHERRFVLMPLAELCPKLAHPQLNHTIEELLAMTKDEAMVRVWKA